MALAASLYDSQRRLSLGGLPLGAPLVDPLLAARTSATLLGPRGLAGSFVDPVVAAQAQAAALGGMPLDPAARLSAGMLELQRAQIAAVEGSRKPGFTHSRLVNMRTIDALRERQDVWASLNKDEEALLLSLPVENLVSEETVNLLIKQLARSRKIFNNLKRRHRSYRKAAVGALKTSLQEFDNIFTPYKEAQKLQEAQQLHQQITGLANLFKSANVAPVVPPALPLAYDPKLGAAPQPQQYGSQPAYPVQPPPFDPRSSRYASPSHDHRRSSSQHRHSSGRYRDHSPSRRY
eukprot:gnl/Hemi2/14205_TR4820_c0_g1_i2.p1 gnl/Hemi2/14205_TR4820_c0_g1~~gnl/Hemi2/14205_TR4820_c0_g1_i2.p1  ORF type:complete len:319 (+),score=116.85 gnl/Hemi2/14205_TR4820_c0_g1_i2:84-959(+)